MKTAITGIILLSVIVTMTASDNVNFLDAALVDALHAALEVKP